MPDFRALSYIPLIFISHAKIRVFSRLCKHSRGKSFSRPLFLIKNTGNRGNKKQPTEEKPKKSSIFALAYLKDR